MKILIILLSTAAVLLFGYYIYLRTIPDKDDSNKINSIGNSNTIMQKVRKPAVAGSFYPAGKDELLKEIDNFLQNVRIENVENIRTPRILLVPHAGYDYSGQVAAYGFKLLQDQAIKNVIILASSHNYPIQGIITDSSDSWETPLGKADLDIELINKLGIKKDSEPFVPEHSLEVQLPFLQRVLREGFKIVPILVGEMEIEEMQGIASQLAENIDENTVLIVSSDMSHYPSYDDASKYDHETIGAILIGDVDQFRVKLGQLERKNVSNTTTFMCAQPAVELGMLIAKEIGADDIKLLKYANSGDVTGDKSRVVGYSAIGFFGKESSVGTRRGAFLQVARDSVESYVKNGKIPNFDSEGMESATFLQKKAGVFVTLTNSGELRGCIGLMESDQPLYKTIPQMAVAAAVDDPRFNPVTTEDLPKLKYEVSVLSPMKKIKDISEIKLGTHGVKVQKDGRSGVFLPQVAQESGWNLEEFMRNLCESKAGLPQDCWKDPATEIYTFTAEVFSD